MDPISAIFVMTVLTGLFVKGVDVATDGLLSAEVGAGVRGAGGFAVRDVRDRWGRANEKAREIRSRTRSGRAVQGIIDDAGAVARTGWLVGRVLFGEASRFGSGARSEWETARDQARSARTERRRDEPWPIVRAARSGHVRVREWAEQRARSGGESPNETANESPNGGPEWDSDDLGSPTAQCPDCGLPIVISTLDDHRRGRDRCPFANDPNGASSDPEPEPNTTVATDGKPWAHVRYDGCLHVTGWATDEEGLRWPRYCGEPREPGWVLCPTHFAARRADPDYPQEDIDEYRADPDHLGPDSYRSGPADLDDERCGVHEVDLPPGACTQVLTWQQVPGEHRTEPIFCGRPGAPDGLVYRCPEHKRDQADDPNGDPNVPLESTVPDENGNVRCGCCAQLHKPLEPGEHCPHCHIHDHPSQNPTGPIPNTPATRGPSMDINSAPTAIAAAEAFAPRFESLQSRADSLAAEWDSLKNDADTLHGEIATLMDGMGDFAIGGEADMAASVGELSESATSAKEQADNVVTSISTAKEAHAAYVDNQHLEYDASIEAAAGKGADAHSVMQEA